MLYMEILFLKTKRKNYLKGSKRMILKCENLKKSYGDFCAIRKINYSFTPGVYGLLGPNGAGKSTWMKLLTASLKPTKGQILCDEMSIYDNINEYVGKIGYVPQNQNMFPYFTGYKFMMYMATLKGVKKEVARKQIPELLKCVNIRNLISEMALGKIVLIATHIVSDVEYISKEILLLKHGEIIGSGNPESLEKELYGVVYEKKVTVEQLKEIQDKYLVAGIREEGNQVVVRYLDSKSDEETTVWPTLDDVYLYHFYKE